MSNILYEPSQASIENSQCWEFMSHINKCTNQTIQTYDELYQWSIKALNHFGRNVHRFAI